VLFLTKMGWATFWALFAPTHLVTLNPKQVFFPFWHPTIVSTLLTSGLTTKPNLAQLN
jgi:hypothetical protein